MTRPLRRQITFWIAVLALGVALLSGGWLLHDVNREAHNRVSELRDVICGVYVPIAQLPLTAKSTHQLRVIVVATRHGAVRISCPGAPR